MLVLKTARTNLRRLKLSDIENMVSLESDPDVVRYTPMRVPKSREESLKRLENQISKEQENGQFGIWVAETSDSFVGWFMLLPNADGSLEIGFMIAREHWGKGLTFEVASRLLDFGFSSVEKIIAKTDLENVRSIRVLEKLGFQFVEEITGKDSQLKVFSQIRSRI